MRAERHSSAIVVQAPAKVNLFLEVLAKRSDGYHDIVTCMAAVNLFDTLELHNLERERGILHTCDQPELPTGPENLVCKAADLLQRHAGVKRGANVRLTKRIPLGAGLAGGSSDAAGTLLGLNELWNLGLPRVELATLAAQLGSDVPFFLLADAAWCSGRGERVMPITLRRPLHLVLAYPGVPCSTAAVYGRVAVPTEPHSGDAVRTALERLDTAALGGALFNRLQEPAEKLCPEVTALRQLAESLKPLGHLMSGSGSTYFLLARDRGHAEELAAATKQQLAPEAQVFVVQSLVTGG